MERAMKPIERVSFKNEDRDVKDRTICSPSAI